MNSPARSAGYSRKPLTQKLGIKPGFRIFVAGAPGPYERLVGKMPDAATLVVRLGGRVAERARLGTKLADYRKAIEPDAMIWVSWPKKASGVATNLSDNVVREIALPLGLVDVKVCAIDATWSGLKFVIRREIRR